MLMIVFTVFGQSSQGGIFNDGSFYICGIRKDFIY